MRRALLAHPHLAALEKAFGRQFISSMETAVQTFDPKIAEHLRKQSDLVMQYTDLLASAKISSGKDIQPQRPRSVYAE